VDAPIAALVIANVAFAAGLVMVYRLAAVRLGENTAERATLLLCVFPYGFVLAAAYPQSLALLFILLALYLAERGRLWPASTFSLLAALTHLLGLALWPALAIIVKRRCSQQKGKVEVEVSPHRWGNPQISNTRALYHTGRMSAQLLDYR
jgi:Gpi18-like mannosyltransferase